MTAGSFAPTTALAFCRFHAKILYLSIFVSLAGCAGEVDVGADGGVQLNCDESKASGIWLTAFGPLSHAIYPGGSAKITVLLARGVVAGSETVGDAVSGARVSFTLLGGGDTATLSQAEATSDATGIATVNFQTDAQTASKLYQVQANYAGTCSATFTIDVQQIKRMLNVASPTPFDTFTKSRIPITVEATSNGLAPLANESITFEIVSGENSGTELSDAAAKEQGKTLTLKTSANGRATAMVSTGSDAIAELKVKATMTGTASVEFVLRVSEGNNTSCADDGGCPLGYYCGDQSLCELIPQVPDTCSTDADCPAPTICHSTLGQCLYGTGQPCDPIEGTGCQAGEVCVGRECAELPTTCTTHGDCPAAWICEQGSCSPQGQPPQGGCLTPSDCPSNQTCINGECKGKEVCNIAHATDRLQGTWQFDANLNLRQSLSGVTSGLLTVSETLRDISQGRFQIDGVPSWLTGLLGSLLQGLMQEYIPPWGLALIAALGDISDIIDDMRVVSTAQLSTTGIPDTYYVSEEWNLVEFDFKGQQLSAAPSSLPQIGTVSVPRYMASEACGVLYLSKHQIKNAVGGLIKWAVDNGLSLITCSTPDIPCYGSVDQALKMALNCSMIGAQIDQAMASQAGFSIGPLVEAGCRLARDTLLAKLLDELDSIETKFSLMRLSGVANIPNPGQDDHLEQGKIYGDLGSGVLKGNFGGSFTATR